MSKDYSRIMRGGKSTGEIRRFAEEADLRKGSKELYKVMENTQKRERSRNDFPVSTRSAKGSITRSDARFTTA